MDMADTKKSILMISKTQKTQKHKTKTQKHKTKTQKHKTKTKNKKKIEMLFSFFFECKKK